MNVKQEQLAKKQSKVPMGTRKKTCAQKSDFKTKKSEEAQNDMRGPYIFQTVCVQMN